MRQSSISRSVSRVYRELVERGAIESDDAQIALAQRLDTLLEALEQRQLSTKSSSLGWLFKKSTEKTGPLKGLYIHGQVGRGKSMMMDIFHEQAPGESKRRVHFNEFMTDAHDRIHRHRQAYERRETRESDPIPPVARDLARDARLLCFDEFSVTDIADAMILGRLFSVLFEKGVVVVATSNVAPDDLYRDGLNRQLFLPFVEMLKLNCDLFELDAEEDFRLAKIKHGQAYLSPASEANQSRMNRLWEDLTADAEKEDPSILLKGREITAERAAGGAAWFSFGELCRKPRGARDFLAVAKRFHTIFLENVPMMDIATRNEAKRFILLIDTLYDARIRTIISAQANPHALYTAGSGTEAFEFQRTASRLIEMQSAVYLAEFEAAAEAREAS